MRCGVSVESIRQVEAGKSVLIDSNGNEHGPYSLVIVADGARSELRAATDLTKKVTRCPWGALWAIVPNSDNLFPQTLFQIYAGTKRFTGFLPTGRGVDSDDPLISIFWSIRLNQVDRWRERDIGRWKDEVLSIAPQVESLLGHITNHDQLAVATYHDVQMRTWNTDHVVYLGDAAHAMSPQLGQGANLALVDAAALADCVAADPANLATALNNYSRQRRANLRYYQFASRWLTPLFQSSLTPLSWPRDFIFEPFARLRFFKKQMVDVLVGAKTGLFATRPQEQVLGFQQQQHK